MCVEEKACATGSTTELKIGTNGYKPL